MALIRAAVVIALMLVFAYNAHLPSEVLVPRNPLFLRIVWLLAALCTVLVFIGLWVDLDLTLLRPIALCIDLSLITAVVSNFAQQGSHLFEIYYLLIIVAAIWYRRTGALTVAAASVGLSVYAEYQITGTSAITLAGNMIWSRLPLYLLVAVTAGYLVRAVERERERSAQIDQELRLARKLQQKMLPESPPEPRGYDIGLQWRPARHVGGDLCVLQLQDDDRFLLVLVDMAGHSVYGLVHLSALYSHLRSAIADKEPVHEIAHRINQGMYEALQPDSFAAAFIGSIQLSTGELTFVNCGHQPPMLVCGENPQRVTTLEGAGIVIGAVKDPLYRPQTTIMEPTDLLVCCTDGIFEARKNEGTKLGQKHILEVISDNPGLSSADLASEILQVSEEFGKSKKDDATILLVRRLSPDSSVD